MNANLLEYLQQSTGYSEPTVKSVIESFYKFIEVSLRNGDEVRIDRFGIFSFRDLPERKGRNPRTGEEIDVDAKRKATFRFSKSFNITPDPAVEPVKPIQVVVEPVSNIPFIPPMPANLVAPKVDKLWYMNINGQAVEVTESKLINRGLIETTALWSQDTGWQLAQDIPELGYLLKKAA
jgi:DNA-binding protein HU-beta